MRILSPIQRCLQPCLCGFIPPTVRTIVTPLNLTVQYQPYCTYYCCWLIFFLTFMHGCIEIAETIKGNVLFLLPSTIHRHPPWLHHCTVLHETVPVSLRLCWSVCFIWFRASRIIKHLQHNQRSHVQNGGGELCCEELLDPDQASVLGICFCYRPHCLLPWQQTEISLHTLHPSASHHWNHPLLSSLLYHSPRRYSPAPLLPASSGVWGIHFNWSLLTCEARPITWLIQMSARSLPFFYLFPSRINLRASCSGRWLNRTARTEWIGLLFTNVSERGCAQRWPSCATTSSYNASPSEEAV